MGGTEGDVDGGEIAVESGGKGTAAAAKTRPAAALSFLEEMKERRQIMLSGKNSSLPIKGEAD